MDRQLERVPSGVGAGVAGVYLVVYFGHGVTQVTAVAFCLGEIAKWFLKVV
jgi:hypothetical protein